jgi:hypothetical protein
MCLLLRYVTAKVEAVTIDKLYEHEIAEARSKLEGFEVELAEFEAQYEMSSDDFFQQFEEGKLGDDMDFFDWSALVQIARNLRARLELLTQETTSQETTS